MGIAPRGHAGEADAVADDVVELAVGEVLGWRLAQIWGLRIEIAADLGLSTAVAAVANGAAIGEVFASLFQDVGRGLPRVGSVAGTAGDGKVADGASYDFFDGGGLVGGAESAAD